MILHFSNHHYVISYDNHIGYMTKTLVQLALENLTSSSGSKGHHCVSIMAKICIKCCQEWWRIIQFLMPISFSTITNCYYTSIHNQVSYVIWHLEMIGFMYYSFVHVCGGNTYEQFQIVWLVFALDQDKAIYPWSYFCDWFEYTCLEHLVCLLLEALL